jgi:TolB protein
MTLQVNSGPQLGRSPGRVDLQHGQVSKVEIVRRDGEGARTILIKNVLIESPNWTPDGKWLIVNSGGKLFRLPSQGGDLEEISTGAIQTCNNDHVLSPDGQRIYISSCGNLYVLPVEGGEPRQISNNHPSSATYRHQYYLHGIAPDESMLAYVSVEPHKGDPRGYRNICLIPATGGADLRLTNSEIPADGPEYSPDGRWIWFNWEKNGHRPGDAQLFRMRPDGSDITQITSDENVNWFPHISPDGQWVAYLAYDPGTISHPADVNVEIRLIPAAGGKPHSLVRFFGGQGSLNVNSWSPDSTEIAFISYPIE